MVVSNENENNFQIISVKKTSGWWMDLFLFENIRSCMSLHNAKNLASRISVL